MMVDGNDDASLTVHSAVNRCVVELEPGDLAALRRWVTRESRSPLSGVFGVVFLCGTVVLVVTAANDDAVLGLGAAGLAILSLVVASGLLRPRRRRALKEAAAKGSGTVSVSESGFELESPTAREDYRWEHFIDLVETRQHLILRCSTMAGHVVPKRSFDSRKAAGEFADFVDAAIRTARRTPNELGSESRANTKPVEP
jgi:hypothetical protein